MSVWIIPDVFFPLALADEPEGEDGPEETRPHERAEVEAMAENDEKRDREAIGADWEKD